MDREVVLADGAVARNAKVTSAYDALAATYADRRVGELDTKPFDRWILERLVDLADGGPVADAGCGPGPGTFHLAVAGADVTGFDLSPGMIDEARRRFPELRFEVADLTALPAPDAGGGWSAIAAWYSLVHLAGSELRPAIALLARGLAPGGWLAVALHIGDEVRHLTELWEQEIDLSFVLHDPSAVLEAFATAGLVDVEWYRRGPLPDGEAETERLYVLARRPA
ncbi:class I SAM-dependent DNA methyltransferase [Aquihabitans daechungensis]|uniref:class I SAM-dependent DNA methyltransferase n=1 Tax=Aquihabitans daechungensis TaxID=1052257 RepID=UPI003B9F2CF3